MRIKSILSMLLLAAAVLTLNNAEAGVPGILIPPGLPGSSVNVHVSGYLPAPPGVTIQIDAGRPYYVESNRRVYMERERPAKHHKHKHHKHKHHKKEKKHHQGHGNRYGHYKEGHGGNGGHGR